MPRAFAGTLLAVAAAAAAGLRAQQPAEPGFATSTTAVVVDVVVRDAKGAPVVDLGASDFELLEDDRQQRITSVQLIAPGPRGRGDECRPAFKKSGRIRDGHGCPGTDG